MQIKKGLESLLIRDNRGLVIESMSQKVSLPNSVDDIEAMQRLLNPLWIWESQMQF